MEKEENLIRKLKHWLKDKPMKFLKLIETMTMILLVIVTGIYAGLVYQSNQIISSQFESENRPYIYVEEVTYFPEELLYDIKITNFGNFPGRYLETSVKPNTDCTEDFLVKEIPRTTVIKPKEEIFLKIDEMPETTGKFNLTIVISYTGIGELSNIVYDYTTTLEINKNIDPISIIIHEGII
jgi:hypothetical protein